MEWRYECLPGALQRTTEIASRCTFNLEQLRYEYPKELSPPGVTPLDYLTRLTWEGAHDRYPDGVPTKVCSLLEHELRLIADLHYEAYFLTVWDLVRFARSPRYSLPGARLSSQLGRLLLSRRPRRSIPTRSTSCSSASSARNARKPPTSMSTSEHERREEVLQYLYKKYGPERAAMTAEVISYRSRSASREIGKALGLTPERIDAIAKTLVDHHRNPETKWEECCRDGGLDLDDRVTRQFIALVNELAGFPRHLSQHVGGMVMTEGLLCEMVPIEKRGHARPHRRRMGTKMISTC